MTAHMGEGRDASTLISVIRVPSPAVPTEMLGRWISAKSALGLPGSASAWIETDMSCQMSRAAPLPWELMIASGCS